MEWTEEDPWNGQEITNFHSFIKLNPVSGEGTTRNRNKGIESMNPVPLHHYLLVTLRNGWIIQKLKIECTTKEKFISLLHQVFTFLPFHYHFFRSYLVCCIIPKIELRMSQMNGSYKIGIL